MRVGMNPMKRVSIDGYAPYIASSIVHLPNFEGSHEQRFEVAKTSLTTIRENAGLNSEILV